MYQTVSQSSMLPPLKQLQSLIIKPLSWVLTPEPHDTVCVAYQPSFSPPNNDGF